MTEEIEEQVEELKHYERLVPTCDEETGPLFKVGLQSIIDEGSCTFILVKPYYWGIGRTLDEALKNCNEERGKKAKCKTLIYIILHTTDKQHEDCWVNGMGEVCWGASLQAVKIVTQM